MRELGHDIRFACRSLLKSRGYLFTVLLSLALGIGASALVAAIIEASAFRAAPYTAPDQLMQVMGTDGYECDARCPDVLTAEQLRVIREQARSFSGIAAFRWGEALIEEAAFRERVGRAMVSGEFFSLLGVPAARGRTLDGSDALAGAAPAVVLSHSLWRERFGGDDRIIGSTIRLDGATYTIVGVMPGEFRYPASARMWTILPSSSLKGTNDAGLYMAVGRLRPGTTPDGMRAELRLIMQREQLRDPVANGGHGATATAIVELERRMPRSTLVLLAGAMGAMLLILLANLQALAMVRTLRHRGALAVRAALGASRWGLVRQLLVECCLLSIVGGGLALLLASWGTDVASALMQRWFSLPLVVRLDAPVLGATCVLAVVAGGVIALAPMAQIFSLDVRGGLSDGGGNASGGRRQRRLRQAAVAMQVMLAVVLLGAAGILARSLLYLQHVDVGYDADHLLVATLDFHGTRYAEPDQARS
jgi:predicted permease